MRILRSALAVLVVSFVCTMGLVINTAAPAAAYTIYDLDKLVKTGLKPTNVGKAATLFGRVSNPAGWLLTAGTVAWWGYSERDSLMEFFHGDETPETLRDWGDLDPEYNPPETPDTLWEDAEHRVELLSASGPTVIFRVQALTCPNGCALFYNNFYFRSSGSTPRSQVVCRLPNGTDETRDIPSVPTVQLGRTNSGGSTDVEVSMEWCNPTETVVGFVVGPIPNNAQPIMTWSSDGILPDGLIEFGEAEVTGRCKNAITGETAEIRATSDLGGSGTVVLPSCKQHLGDDWYGTGFTVAPTKPEIDNEPLPDEIEVPDFLPFDWDELIPDPTNEEDWQPCFGTKTGCELDFWIDDEPCAVGRPVCTKVRTMLDNHPNRIECRYGTKIVPEKNCYPLIGAYKPDTETNLDTGTEAPPTGDTGTDTGTGTGTQTQVQPKPNVENDTAKDKCFPSGWNAFNPIEWVYRPVKCALTWAFVPETPFSERMSRMKDEVMTRAPFKWAASVAALPAVIPSSGCPDWRIRVNSVDKNIICGTPFGDAMRAARPVWAVLMIGAAVWPLMRSVMYASFPIIKPVPK